MPDKVEQQIDELQTIIKYPNEVFIKELLLTYKIFFEKKFLDLENKIKNGLIKALEAFK